MITSKTLRRVYACELWQARILRESFSKSEFAAVRLGMESGIWAVQKMLMRDILK
jgi:hypothetical protein